MRIAGLDVGDRTIGVSISDPMGVIAQGVETIRRKKLEDDILKLVNFINENNVLKLVVGLPKNMNGTIGFQGEKVISFVDEVKKNVNIDIVMWDERLSTKVVTSAMIEGNVRREKRKKIVDTLAAEYILQGYLDSIRKNS